ncbi:MAG: undecaprenyl-diphosphate phosphatase [Alphaproteobacteria bacterium]
MSLFHLILVALVQGITEFLPISSSGHLILLPKLTGMPDQGPVIDVAVHVGTLMAVLIYFRADVLSAAKGGLAGGDAKGKRLFWALVLGTIPVVIAGGILKLTGGDQAMRSIVVIGWATLGFGVVLWIADRFAPLVRSMDSIGLKDGLLIGLAQILALIPGTSRAGITITAARALGFNREDAARFSMLLAIPTIAAAGVLTTADLVSQGNIALGLDALFAALLAFAAAYLAIAFFMRWLQKATLTPFVIYRIVLGVILIVIGHGLIDV